MGFFKRFMSIRSLRNKKQRSPWDETLLAIEYEAMSSDPTGGGQSPVSPASPQPSNPPLLKASTSLSNLPKPKEESDLEETRLLRSSSTHYKVVSEFDYSSLPPIPHPINDILRQPKSSSASLATTTNSQKGTYTVTITERVHHSSTEVPSTSHYLLETPPRNNSTLIGLRSDPSVASLLNIYDDNMQLPEQAFANTPPGPVPVVYEGRAQVKRSGSTLRQLLGDPKSSNRMEHRSNSESSTVEGDISWAERYLKEMDNMSIESSLGLRTPNEPLDSHLPNVSQDPQSHFSDSEYGSEPSFGLYMHNTSQASTSLDLDVDSIVSDVEEVHDSCQFIDPETPQRASQVFRFLTEKRKSAPPTADYPNQIASSSDTSGDSMFSSTTSSPAKSDGSVSLNSSGAHSEHQHDTSNFLSLLSYDNNSSSSTHTHNSRISRYGHRTSASTSALTSFSDRDSHEASRLISQLELIITDPTPSRSTPSRIHRSLSLSDKDEEAVIQLALTSSRYPLNTRLNSFFPKSDPFTSLPTSGTRTKKAHLMSSSSTSCAGAGMLSTKASKDKENVRLSHVNMAANPPSTPSRSKSIDNSSLRTNVWKTPVPAPSPVSSSELSPVGKQVMFDLRAQRSRAREARRSIILSSRR